MQPSSTSKSSRLGLRIALVGPFVVLNLIAVSLVGYFSWQNGRSVTTDLAAQLKAEVGDRIEDRLDAYLQTPLLINNLNIDAIELEQIAIPSSREETSPADVRDLELHFWQQTRRFPTSSYIYFGSPYGAFVGAGPDPESTPQIGYWDGNGSRRQFITYASTPDGERAEELSALDYTLDQRPWYIAGQEAGDRTVWGDVYVWVAPFANLALPSVRGVYDASGEFQGVLAVDVSLNEISGFLRELEIGKTGIGFIYERETGLLVATSTKEEPFVVTGDDGVARVNVADFSNPIVGRTLAEIEERGGIGTVSNLDAPVRFQLDGETYLATAIPYRDDRGLDWAIAIAVPQSDFTAEIDRKSQAILWFVGGTLVATLGASIWLASRLARPIRELSTAAERLAAGNLEQRAAEAGVAELQTLSRAFNAMARQLQGSIEQLETTNRELEARVEARTAELAAQEEQARQENLLLQGDVGHLLDIVSDLEQGDFSVQALVSDRFTGLVGDTLNRLIEQLSQVMAQVLDATRQVAQNSASLDNMAQGVASNVEQQVRSAGETQTIAEQVAHLAGTSSELVNQTNSAVLAERDAIARGQAAIVQLSEGISTLQQGSDRIVQRMKTLGEFVGLAEKFVQDQGQIASMTQVLALNATLVAARASEQNDPLQFSVVAGEFEAIASQVSELARQTNEGLEDLQQRTAQIHSVVAAVDADVQGLDELVEAFTQGVEQSQQVYAEVESVSEQVMTSGQEVEIANEQIAQAARDTTRATRAIAELAQQTAALTREARQQSERLEALSESLLGEVQFFRLPEQILPSEADKKEAVLR